MKSEKRKIILCSGIANTFEWYDYALFGNFAEIIGKKFFPSDDPHASMLNAFLVFAVGYLMRPIGGIFFGVIGDKYGRKFALSSSIMCMALPTAIIGIIPTYDAIGPLASWIMVIMRMLQGLSMGGALTGSISFLIEHTEHKNRGFVGSIPMSSICLGIFLGTIVSYITRSSFSKEEFELFGWRIPFIIGILILFVGFYIKRYTEETPLFKAMQQEKRIVASPLKVVMKNNLFDMLISLLINSIGSVIFYFQAIYVPNYLKYTRGFSHDKVDQLNLCCYIIMAIACMISGKISDKLKSRKRIFVFIIANLLISITAINDSIEFGDWSFVIFAQVVLSIIAAFYIGPEPALQAEFYPTEIRSTALSISYNLATSIFGGTTPYIIGYLYSKTHSLYGCGYYVIATSILSLIGLMLYKTRYENIQSLKAAL